MLLWLNLTQQPSTTQSHTHPPPTCNKGMLPFKSRLSIKQQTAVFSRFSFPGQKEGKRRSDSWVEMEIDLIKQ